jgi:hypothetical protein
MTGGILDLIARGHEDIYLSSDPNITFFKMVYRRHTNFSKDELDLNFNNKLTFGKEGYCKISHYGDLVHRLILSIKLPQIDIFFNQQTVQDIKTLLSSCDIIWNPVDVTPTTKFTTELNESAQKLINLKVVALNTELQIVDHILNTLSTEGMFNAQIWKNNNPDSTVIQYIDDILLNYMQHDRYNVIYQIVNAITKDTKEKELPLANSTQIHQSIFNELLNYVTSEDFNPFTYNDTNIQFLYNILTTSYNIYNPTSSLYLFNFSIDKTYSALPIYSTYKQLDSYKIFNYTLTNSETPINLNTNIQTIQFALFSNVFYGIQTNTILQKYVYNTLTENTNYVFYRKFTKQGLNIYNTSSLFVNQSLIPTKDVLLDIIIENSNLLASDISYPKILYNYYTDIILSSFKKNQTLNTNSFRNNNFNQYFNDFSLWQRTLTNNNTFFLNNIWLAMNEDIPKALIDYIYNKVDENKRVELFTILNDTQNIIHDIIQPKINNNSYFEIINDLQKIKNPSDFIMTSIFGPNQNNLVLNITIPEYVINSYTDIINTFKLTLDNEMIYDNLINIINSFMSNTIPTYSKNLNYKYVNIQSSIINNIFLSIVSNYNNLYNGTVLGYDNINTNIGSEFLQQITTISEMYFNFDITRTSTYDYFRNNSQYQQYLPNINEYIMNNLELLKSQLLYFIDNKTLLNMKNILVSNHQYYYQEYHIVLNYIINIINNNPSLYPYTTRGQSNDIVSLTNSTLSDTTLEYTTPRNNALDVTNKMHLIVTTFLNQVENPFPMGSNLANLWDIIIFNINVVNESSNFNNLFRWLYNPTAPESLYNFHQQIDLLYNNFTLENDVYKFIKDYIIQKSFLKDVPQLINSDINGTYLNVLNYFVNLRKNNRLNYDKIHGLNDDLSLSETLNLAVTTETVRANFAWVKKIGHYIINSISIKFDDQLITTLYGEWMEIWHSLTKEINREIGYNKLIGNIVELYSFDNRQKETYELLIPIPFWFCNHIGVSLPLVAMNNSEVKIYVKLKEFNEVCYYDKFTKFRRPPKLTCKMIAEYIYVEANERDKISKSKLQYQVDILQYNGDVTVTKDSFSSEQILQSVIRFFGPCKELFWVLQDVSYIDGSLPNGKRKWDKYDYNDTKTPINPIKQASIQFNGRNREEFKDSIVYNYIYPMEKHMSDPALGVNIYSFSLDPASVQSKGTANLGKIDDASISITLMPNVMNNLNNNKVMFRFAIYCLSINMLRVCSGLAGLMYYG